MLETILIAVLNAMLDAVSIAVLLAMLKAIAIAVITAMLEAVPTAVLTAMLETMLIGILDFSCLEHQGATGRNLSYKFQQGVEPATNTYITQHPYSMSYLGNNQFQLQCLMQCLVQC